MNLTPEEQNLIKDILKTIGNDDELTEQFALAVGMPLDGTEDKFNVLCDSIFDKCQNGRLTISE